MPGAHAVVAAHQPAVIGVTAEGRRTYSRLLDAAFMGMVLPQSAHFTVLLGFFHEL